MEENIPSNFLVSKEKSHPGGASALSPTAGSCLPACVQAPGLSLPAVEEALPLLPAAQYPLVTVAHVALLDYSREEGQMVGQAQGLAKR